MIVKGSAVRVLDGPREGAIGRVIEIGNSHRGTRRMLKVESRPEALFGTTKQRYRKPKGLPRLRAGRGIASKF